MDEEVELPIVEEGSKFKTADLVLVIIAAIGFVLVVYYIGFSHVKTPGFQPPENISQNESSNYTEVPGIVSSITYIGNRTNFSSRESYNLQLRIACERSCSGLFLSVYNGPDALANYESVAAWSNSVDISVPIVIPRTPSGTLSLLVKADSNESADVPESQKTLTFAVKEVPQNVTYGNTFYLQTGETANLSALNVTIKLAQLNSNGAKIEVTELGGIIYGITLNQQTKPNATFFDILTIQLLNTSSNEVQLVAWPNGVIDSISIQYPLGPNITTSEPFSIWLRCSGTCSGAYVGVHILYNNSLARIGFSNETDAWTDIKIVNITASIPDSFINESSEIMVLADSRNSRNAMFYDLWNPAEKSVSKTFYVQ